MYPHPARIYGDILPGSEFIRSLVRQGTISQEAAKKLRWFDHYARCGNAQLTCRYFGISAQTFYCSGRVQMLDSTFFQGVMFFKGRMGGVCPFAQSPIRRIEQHKYERGP